MKLKLNEQTKIKTIGFLTIIIGLWLILYFIPEVFVSLFNTLLGNLILVISVFLLFMNNKIYGIIAGLIIILLYRFLTLSKEGFKGFQISGSFTINDTNSQTSSESLQDLQKNFLKIQNTINKNKVFDMNTIKSQASQEELSYFNKNGKWPWSQKVINLYQEAVKSNPYIRTTPEQATNYARTIYNQNAILTLLSYQTKEGEFLLNGVLVKDPSGNPMEELPSGFGDFPYESGLLGNRVDDIIKCNLKNEQNPTLERIRYTGKGGIFGEQTQKVTPVDYHNLENIIPGFNFLNGPCNPCLAMAKIPDYSCPFKLKVKGKSPFISDVWQTLWNINDNPLVSQPSFLNEYINPNEFPLLSELQTELQNQKSNTTSNTNTNSITNYNRNH
jgi:hypothetical protein